MRLKVCACVCSTVEETVTLYACYFQVVDTAQAIKKLCSVASVTEVFVCVYACVEVS